MEQIKTKPIEIKSKQVGFHKFDPTNNSPPSVFMSKLLIRSHRTILTAERTLQNANGVLRTNI